MSKEVLILILAWTITTTMLILYVPRNKAREAWVIFLFKQFMTWLLGLIVVQYGLIEYPVRSFSNATKTSFDFEYFIYPSLCVVFNLHYPEGKSRTRQFLHYFYFCSVMTAIEVLCERYTNTIEYIHWDWYLTWITLFATFYASRHYYLWFFKIKPKS